MIPADQVDIHGQELPVHFLGKWLGLNFPVEEYLGAQLNLKAHYEQNRLILSAQTPLLQIPNLNLSLENGVHLQQPASFTYSPLDGSITQFDLGKGESFNQLKLKAAIKGPQFHLLHQLAAEVTIDSFESIQFNLKSQEMNTAGEVSYLSPELIIKKPIKVEGEITDPLVAHFFPSKTAFFKPGHFTLQIDPLTLNFDQDKSLKLSGKAAIEELDMTHGQNLIVFKKVQIPFHYNQQNETADFKLSGQIVDEKQKGKVELEAQLSHLSQGIEIKSEAHLDNISPSFYRSTDGHQSTSRDGRQ